MTCMERDNVLMVHGDDIVSTANTEEPRWLEGMLKEKFGNNDRNHRTR